MIEDWLLESPSHPLGWFVAFPFHFHGRYDAQRDDGQQGVGELRTELYFIEGIVVRTVRNNEILRGVDQAPAIRPHDLLFIFRGGITFCIQYPVVIAALCEDHDCDKERLFPITGNKGGLTIHAV